MADKNKFIFLSNDFYNDYPSNKYPEMEQKVNRPYIQIYIDIGGLRFAIPLRSDIQHPYVLWTDKANHCGVDFSKAVLITSEKYIDKSVIPHLRQNEFNALRGKGYKIKAKMQDYLNKYKNAKKDLSDPWNQKIVKYSTLQYFENELGINSAYSITHQRKEGQ